MISIRYLTANNNSTEKENLEMLDLYDMIARIMFLYRHCPKYHSKIISYLKGGVV